MGRSRKIHTDISIDTKLNRVSDLAALLYTWMIAHTADNCRLSAKNAEELRLSVMPGRRRTDEDVDLAVGELIDQELVGRDNDGRYYLPSKNFYKYQSYINQSARADTPPIISGDQRKTPEISGDQRRSAENAGDQRVSPEKAASPSLSPPLSLSLSKAGRDDAPADLEINVEGLLADEPRKDWHKPFKEIYQSDQGRFALLFGWCIAAENKGYAGARVADALTEFQRYDAKSKVDSWARYLDILIDRRTARDNARDFENAHDSEKEAEAAWAKGNLRLA
jgi:hypothetical protein